MFDGVSGRTNWRGAWLTATAVVVILASAGVAILLVGRKPDELASASIDPPRSIHFSSHRPANFDDSGFRAVTSFELPVKDPSSLEHLRDCYQGAGRRGVLAIRKELAQSSLLPLQRLERLETLARCHLYEAEFRQALLDCGIPARLLPPIDEAGLEPPADPPLPPDVESDENKQ